MVVNFPSLLGFYHVADSNGELFSTFPNRVVFRVVDTLGF
ncbi:MAG: hypothetical protein RL240_2620 [Planctomycetota bacterium]|jgi:hypothetical protein